MMATAEPIWSQYILPFVAAKDRKSLGRIAEEAIRYKRHYNLRPIEYLRLALYMKCVTEDVRKYLPNALVYHFNKVVNDAADLYIATDKIKTAERLLDNEIRCVHDMVLFDPKEGFSNANGTPQDIGQVCEAISRVGGRAFVKPRAGANGRGAHIVTADRKDVLAIAHSDEQMIFQPLIEQHPTLASLNPSSVNTIRINTLRTDDEVESHVATLRVGRKGSVVDNAAGGGVCVKIDMATGRLAPFGRTKAHFATQAWEQHPDSGIDFYTVVIPFWAEVLEIVKRGARAMAPLRSLGWDITITRDGPMVIEANALWDPVVFQLCQPLGGTRLGDQILAVNGRSNPWAGPNS